ncbi:hypothetical protein [Hymenobacter psychrophilus]|uniref:hypothetical protein n=1 Tax=Hymenobacter psychrophilus TaxID=651662 RepID=UPI001114FAC6|nr:hypothetical protein [Hymenobacter psychrophilus]
MVPAIKAQANTYRTSLSAPADQARARQLTPRRPAAPPPRRPAALNRQFGRGTVRPAASLAPPTPPGSKTCCWWAEVPGRLP